MKTNLTEFKAGAAFRSTPVLYRLVTFLVIVALAVACSKDEEETPPELTISSVSPNSGGEGTEVNINGTGFSTIAAENVVTLNSKNCPVLVATGTLLKVTIPEGATSGNLVVISKGRTAQSPVFTVIPPEPELTVTSIAPTSGPKGTQVVITGTGFRATASQNTVTLNGIASTVVNATVTQLTIVIPAGAGSGNIEVTVNGNTVQSESFEYLLSTTVSTLAGSTSGFADGLGSAAQFSQPHTVAVDADGNVYVADMGNHAIRKITPNGETTLLAGGTQGDADGSGANAQFNYPYGVATDADGNVYVADTHNHKVRKITPAGVVTTLAGSTGGSADGAGASAQFYYLTGITVAEDGNIYVADKDNHKIRKVTPSGEVTTLAGSTAGFADGTGAAAQFSQPYTVSVDSEGNIYTADAGNHRIRKITQNGVVTTLAGESQGDTDGTGAAAQFNYPYGVATDAEGNVYVADTHNHKVKKVTPAGVVTTIAGTTGGSADGGVSEAQFYYLTDLTVGGDGTIYVAEKDNHKIRKIVFD